MPPLTTGTTGLDLITRAMRMAGIIGATEVPSGDDVDDVGLILNGMIDSWAAEFINIFTTLITQQVLVANQQSYTIGLSGTPNFNVQRPERLLNATLKILTSPSLPVEIPLLIIDHTQWMNIPVKQVTGTYPTKVYYSPDYPNGTLFFWPIPTAGLNVVLDYWIALNQFVNYTDLFNFPPGYFEAMYSNLALRLCTPEWGIDAVPQSINSFAGQALARIQALNSNPPPVMGTDFGTQSQTREQGYRNLYNPAPLWVR